MKLFTPEGGIKNKSNYKTMKKIIYILGFLVLTVTFNGCDYILTPKSHYVSLYNGEYDKYVTSVYYRNSFFDDMWSPNVICSDIYPYDYTDVLFDEGTYDFKIIMEDDYYFYEVRINSVCVCDDINLDIYLDNYDKKSNTEIIKTPKAKQEDSKEKTSKK